MMLKCAAQALRILPLTAVLQACSGYDSKGNTQSPSALPSPTLDAATRSAPVVAGRPARVFIFAGWEDNCAALPAPEVTVTSAPAKGDVTFRPGQETTIAASATGTCAGRKATGTGVYYTARAGMGGTDRFAVEARLSSGEKTSRVFEVTIAE